VAVGNCDGNAKDVCYHHHHLLVTDTCLGPSGRTAQTYSDASTKTAILHLRRVHRCQDNGHPEVISVRVSERRLARQSPVLPLWRVPEVRCT